MKQSPETLFGWNKTLQELQAQSKRPLFRKNARNLTPATPVCDKALSKAWKILNQQHLSVYQRLYAVGLTCAAPYGQGFPFVVERDPQAMMTIRVYPYGYESYGFWVRTAAEVETVVAKAESLFQALTQGKERVHALACCPLATYNNCVCHVSFRCDIHGFQCHGTHD